MAVDPLDLRCWRWVTERTGGGGRIWLYSCLQRSINILVYLATKPNIRLIYGVLSDDSNRKLTGLLNLFPQVKSQLEKEEHRIDEFRPFRDPSVVLGSTYG